MKYRIIPMALVIVLVIIAPTMAATEVLLHISGTVNQSLSLAMEDLETFQLSRVQFNDIRENGQFNGVFTCRGVSLKTLLMVANIEKKETDFKKQIDLAVVVKNRLGEQVVLSWGEIFYQNPDHIIIATSAVPIYPHHGVDYFDDKTAYEQMMKTLNRKISFPKLVVTGDLFSDRSLEAVFDIVVMDLKPEVEGQKSPSVYSGSFRIVQSGKPGLIFTQLPEGANESVQLNIVGEGRGYHGTRKASGISFKALVEPYQSGFNLNTVFIVSAPDAYRSLISYGELFLNPHGNRIMVADKFNGSPIENDGKFILQFPDDLMADREVKAVSKIEIMNLN